MADPQQTPSPETSPHQGQSTEELRKKFHETLQNLREIGDQIKALSYEEFNDLSNRVLESYGRRRQQVDAWERELTDSVHKNPLQALLIAAGLGMLVGFFWRRR